MDRIVKLCLSKLDRMEERLNLLEESYSSFNVLIRIIKTATGSSAGTIAQIAHVW